MNRETNGARWLAMLVAIFGLAAPVSRGAQVGGPPAESRILKIIHSWPDQADAQDQLIGRLERQGFGGVVCNVSFDDYLESPAKWEAFSRAVREAKKAGMALWLYDERGYPSGNAGGLVLSNHPDWEARGLLIADLECDGGSVALKQPPGRPFLATAFPVRNGNIDLRKRVDLSGHISEGELDWQAPTGRWRVMLVTENRLYEGTHAEGNLWRKMPYINLLMPEPTARFLEVTHQRYADRLGKDLGKPFVATFTDEPSLMSLFLRPMPYRGLPWSPGLALEFRKRRGYALEPVVPALVADAGSGGQKARYDFWLTVGELVSENYFSQIQDWCRRHNLQSGGHLLMEESLVAQVPLYGSFLRCARRLDSPGIDCLTSVPAEVPWYIARLLASVAELEGRPLVMCETSDHGQRYRPAGDKRPVRTVTEAEIRGTCNRLIVSGVNRITSYYSFAALTDEQLRRLNEWVGVCCNALTGGRQVADIAVLYPEETVWTKFTPARHLAGESPAATQVEVRCRSAAESLFAAQRDFTFVDSRALSEAKVKSGVLVHGELRWRVVVLPGADTLPMAAWENLARFVRSGGIVIALGARPANSESEFPSSRVQSLAREMFDRPSRDPRVKASKSGGAGILLPVGSEGLLATILDGVLEPDVKPGGVRAPLRATHRHVDGREVYFLINDSNRSWHGEVALCATGPGEELDVAEGNVRRTGLGDHVSLSLEPYGAVLLRFPGARLPGRRPASSGALPNLTLQTIPEVSPSLAKGEFVRAELNREPAYPRKQQPAWQATGVLTKGQVDTFLFVDFAYPKPLDLEGVDCLVIDTWVPEGQRTPSQILVIVREEGGGDFIATTGRGLGSPGQTRVCIPLSRFELAGWSKDEDGLLDLKRLSEIRVGWGGYLGAEGERVQFSAALPQIGTASTSGAERSSPR